MKNIYAWAIFLASASIPALAAEAEKAPDFQIAVDPKVYSADEFRSQGTVKPMKEPQGSIPNRDTREAAFEKVPGLAKAVSQMDELDRDKLFVFARVKSLDELQKLYPQLSKETLRKLQATLR